MDKKEKKKEEKVYENDLKFEEFVLTKDRMKEDKDKIREELRHNDGSMIDLPGKGRVILQGSWLDKDDNIVICYSDLR